MGLMKVLIISLGYKRTPKEDGGQITNMGLLLRACSMDTPLSQQVNEANIWLLHFKIFVGTSWEYYSENASAKVTSFQVNEGAGQYWYAREASTLGWAEDYLLST